MPATLSKGKAILKEFSLLTTQRAGLSWRVFQISNWKVPVFYKGDGGHKVWGKEH